MEFLSASEYHKRAREINAGTDLPPLHLGVLASFTLEPLRPYLMVEGAAQGLHIDAWFGPFNQLEQQVFVESSEVWMQPLDALWLFLRVEDALPTLLDDGGALRSEEIADGLRRCVERLLEMVREVRRRSTRLVICSNLALPELFAGNPFDAADPDGFGALLAEANRNLARGLRAMSGTLLFDYAGLVAHGGGERWTDRRLWFTARMAIAPAHWPALAYWFTRTLASTRRPRLKCLVLDLDNTLWGGVLGDDGMEGIQLGHDYPGNAYRAFQQALLGYRARGILLAVASKNDAPLVLQTLDEHPEQLIHREHLAAIYVNWEAKSRNLRLIADELHIGLESLAFIDDNPLEREEVRQELPMVLVVDLPAQAIDYVAALRAVSELDTPWLLEEDRQRAEMYAREQSRQRLAGTADLATFLRELHMVAQVGLAETGQLPRIQQLIQKTNQFNLTTTRYTLEELQALSQLPTMRVAWLRLADRYGDMGLVCAGILRQQAPRNWQVDTLLMSCRVMGRRVEEAFVHFLEGIARDAGADTLEAAYHATAKNHIVADLYAHLGYSEIEVTGEVTRYSKCLATHGCAWPECIIRQ